jgi:putative oxidoreductase
MKDLGLLILRLGFGGNMLVHGISKIGKIIGGDVGFANPLGLGEAPSLFLATFAEFACAILIIIGFKTKLASIPLAVTMAVAAFVTHFSDPWGSKEMAFLYMVGFISIGLMGAGKYSIDRK